MVLYPVESLESIIDGDDSTGNDRFKYPDDERCVE
jgi:hypothetical protein